MRATSTNVLIAAFAAPALACAAATLEPRPLPVLPASPPLPVPHLVPEKTLEDLALIVDGRPRPKDGSAHDIAYGAPLERFVEDLLENEHFAREIAPRIVLRGYQTNFDSPFQVGFYILKSSQAQRVRPISYASRAANAMSSWFIPGGIPDKPFGSAATLIGPTSKGTRRRVTGAEVSCSTPRARRCAGAGLTSCTARARPQTRRRDPHEHAV